MCPRPPPHPPTHPPTHSHTRGKVTLLVVYNTSYSVALYGLLMFYKATRPLLTPFKPVQKFFAVKSVIFATYWQSVVVHFIPGVSRLLLMCPSSIFVERVLLSHLRDCPFLFFLSPSFVVFCVVSCVFVVVSLSARLLVLRYCLFLFRLLFFSFAASLLSRCCHFLYRVLLRAYLFLHDDRVSSIALLPLL